MRNTFALVLAALAVSVVQPAAGPGQAPNQRTVSVLVLGRGDTPVPDLTEQDFTVKEDGATREIVRVSPSPAPSHIVLLVDDSQATTTAIREVRSSLNSFADMMADQSPAPSIRLTSFGDRPTVLTDFSSTFSAVSRGIERLQARPGAGATLLEAIIETCRDLDKLKIKGAVIIAFVAESGPEYSTLQSQGVASALRRSQASLWPISLQSRGDGAANAGSESNRERARVIGDVAPQSGGRNEVALSEQSLPNAFSKVATQLLSRYDVTYGRPDRLIPPSRLEVTARDRSWKLQVSRWPAE